MLFMLQYGTKPESQLLTVCNVALKPCLATNVTNIIVEYHSILERFGLHTVRTPVI